MFISHIFLNGKTLDLKRCCQSTSVWIIVNKATIYHAVTKPNRKCLKSIDCIITFLESVTVKDVISCDNISDHNAPYVVTSMCKLKYEPSTMFWRRTLARNLKRIWEELWWWHLYFWCWETSFDPCLCCRWPWKKVIYSTYCFLKLLKYTFAKSHPSTSSVA